MSLTANCVLYFEVVIWHSFFTYSDGQSAVSLNKARPTQWIVNLKAFKNGLYEIWVWRPIACCNLTQLILKFFQLSFGQIGISRLFEHAWIVTNIRRRNLNMICCATAKRVMPSVNHWSDCPSHLLYECSPLAFGKQVVNRGAFHSLFNAAAGAGSASAHPLADEMHAQPWTKVPSIPKFGSRASHAVMQSQRRDSYHRLLAWIASCIWYWHVCSDFG